MHITYTKIYKHPDKWSTSVFVITLNESCNYFKWVNCMMGNQNESHKQQLWKYLERCRFLCNYIILVPIDPSVRTVESQTNKKLDIAF